MLQPDTLPARPSGESPPAPNRRRDMMQDAREVGAPPVRPPSQRALVIASLLLCDREDPPTHRRRP